MKPFFKCFLTKYNNQYHKSYFENIVNILKNKPTVTQEEIASEINKSLRTVKKYMAEMQEKGLIKRVNSRKNGKWIVKLYNK